MTAAERLKLLSGNGGTSAASRIRRLGVVGVSAGALLAAYSGLATASAAKHLLTDKPNYVLLKGDDDYSSQNHRREDLKEMNHQIITSMLLSLVTSGVLEE